MNRKPTLLELGLDKMALDRLNPSRKDSQGYNVAWTIAYRWVNWWREHHPDDQRDDYELITEEYGGVEE